MAKKVKEMYSYVCPDIMKEFAKYDKQPDKYFKTYSVTKVISHMRIKSYALRIVFILETNGTAVDM